VPFETPQRELAREEIDDVPLHGGGSGRPGDTGDEDRGEQSAGVRIQDVDAARDVAEGGVGELGVCLSLNRRHDRAEEKAVNKKRQQRVKEGLLPLRKI